MKSCAITEKISRMSVLLLIVGVPDASVASGGVANRCPTGEVGVHWAKQVSNGRTFTGKSRLVVI